MRCTVSKIWKKTKCVLWFSLHFCLKTFSFSEELRYTLSRTYVGVYVKSQLFLSHFNDTRIFSTDIRNILKYQVSWISVQCGPSCSVRTDKTRHGEIHGEIKSSFFSFLFFPPFFPSFFLFFSFFFSFLRTCLTTEWRNSSPSVDNKFKFYVISFGFLYEFFKVFGNYTYHQIILSKIMLSARWVFSLFLRFSN